MDTQELKEMQALLCKMGKVGASDLHLKVGSPPIYRIHGTPQRLKTDPLTQSRLIQMCRSIMNEEQMQELARAGAVDFAYHIQGEGRWRVNVFQQRGATSFVARLVNNAVPSFEALMLPKAVNRLPALDDGLILVVGMTGSGKSTTLAAIIDKINHTRRAHILTIEDPIEYIHYDDKSFINQREIGLDAQDFKSALRSALRQDPDVILVGEMRDADTVETALAASETGHLVLGTLHATNAMQTITRILEFFPPDRQHGIRQVLSYSLRAVVGQRLLPGIKTEHPRVPAVELMIVTPAIRKYIAEGEDARIPDAIRQMAKDGMQDFNMSLLKLVKDGYVTEDAALERSPNPEQLAMQFKGMTLSSDAS